MLCLVELDHRVMYEGTVRYESVVMTDLELATELAESWLNQPRGKDDWFIAKITEMGSPIDWNPMKDDRGFEFGKIVFKKVVE